MKTYPIWKLIFCTYLVAALPGCDRKATQALKQDFAHSASQVTVLNQQVSELRDQMEDVRATLQDQTATQETLLKQARTQLSTIAALEAEVKALKSADSATMSSLALERATNAQIKTALNDVFKLLQQEKVTNQESLKQIQARQERIEADSLPIKQRIADLTKKRDIAAARLELLTGPLPKTSAKGITSSMEAQVNIEMLAERDRIYGPEIKQLNITIEQIDRAIQTEQQNLMALQPQR